MISLLRRWRRVTPAPRATRGPSVNLFANLVDDWVLNDIANAVIRHSETPCHPVHHPEWESLKAEPPFSTASLQFFIHYSLYRDYLHRNPVGDDVVFFTHFWPRTQERAAAEAEKAEMLETLKKARLIISMSTHWKDELVRLGIPEDRVAAEVVAADTRRFTPAIQPARARPVVGLVSAYKDNKNEPFIREMVRAHPECDWVLLGRRWERSGLLKALAGAPNFRYLERPLAQWPDVYRGFDAFVSPALAEGGPVPLLEAMATGVWPLATRTGHAGDVIRDGENGAFFDPSDMAEFGRKLRAGLALGGSRAGAIRASVEHLTWERFGKSVNARLQALLAREAGA